MLGVQSLVLEDNVPSKKEMKMLFYKNFNSIDKRFAILSGSLAWYMIPEVYPREKGKKVLSCGKKGIARFSNMYIEKK